VTPTRRFAFLAGAAAAVAAVLGPLPLDRRPPLEQPYGREALAAARALSGRVDGEVRAGRGPLRAGFGIAEIAVPARGVPLAGYGVRAQNRSTSVHDPVKARAVALARGEGAPLLILGADILLVNERLAEAVGARLGDVPRERVLFTATHTHSGPGGFGTTIGERIAMGPFDGEVARAIEEALVAAGRQAIADLAPAKLRAAHARVPELVRDRYWEGRRPTPPPVDDDLALIEVVRDDGRRGLVVSYAAHATVIGGKGQFVSADYPGVFARDFEAVGGGHAVVLLAAGAIGSQAPHPPGAAGEIEATMAMGRTLASRARQALAMAGPFATDPALGGSGAAIRLPPLQPRLAPDLRVSPLVAGTQSNDRSYITAFRIGTEVLIGLPGELSGELALELKARVAGPTGGLRAWPLPFNGDYAGYVLPDAYYGRWEYENKMSFHGPHMGSYLVALAAAAAGADASPPP